MMLWQRKLRYRFAGRKKQTAVKKRRGVVFLCCGILLAAAAVLFVHTEHRIGMIAMEAAVSEWNGRITTEVNRIIAELADSLPNHSGIFSSEAQKEIVSFDADVGKINQLKSEIAVRLQAFLDQTDTVETTVPAGFLISETMLTGFGFKIPIKMFVTGTVEIDFHDEFTGEGINQTRIAMLAEVKIPARVIGLLESKDTMITTQVPVAEKIVIGKVPNMIFREKTDKN